MTIGIWVLGNQLWAEQAALSSCAPNRAQTPVILIESRHYLHQRPFHRQKLVLVWSAMRHFAEELRAAGWPVTYAIADNFVSALSDWVKAHGIAEVRVMVPSDRPLAQFLRTLQLDCPLKVIPNNHFLWSAAEFQAWASDRKRLLLEDFYRAGRKRFNILMEGDRPVGGQWNFDKQNRRPPKSKLETPIPAWFEPDAITRGVIDELKALNPNGYGDLEPFRWGVTRSNALAVLEHFLTQGLPAFGPYQDAMAIGEETMWHSLISPYLNLGLLTPLETIAAAQTAYLERNIALNSIEGFIRQVLGWREYLHGLYHYVDADYRDRNWFGHCEPLPAFFWQSAQTDLNCLRQVLGQVERTGYAHHIQRLMVLSNFALIVGVSPQELDAWFQAAFVDAYDWVMLPNTIGMGQFADGGIVASKPYAASANYINKMSNYCKSCAYNPRDRSGPNACPFNVFYWDFLARHQVRLSSLGRMGLALGNLRKIEPAELSQVQNLADLWRQKLKR